MSLIAHHSLLTQAQIGNITYFGSASNPADGGSNGTTPAIVTPPASMVVGDLVLFYGLTRETALGNGGFTISQAGGQSWNTITWVPGTPAAVSHKLFWCRFNGTWSANPSIAIASSASNRTAVMHVFRPTVNTNNWSVSVSQVVTAFAAPLTPFTVTVTGVTPVHFSTVTIATWATHLNVTWGTLTGTGWVVTGGSQYRNTAGATSSITFAHKIQNTVVATGNVSKNQSSGNPGVTSILTFYEH